MKKHSRAKQSTSSQTSPRQPTKAAQWYNHPDFVLACRPFPLTEDQLKKLLDIAGVKNPTIAMANEFAEHISVAVGSYLATVEYFKAIRPEQLGRRLKWLRDRTYELLAAKLKGLNNPDEVTKALLTDALFREHLDLSMVQDAILALYNAANRALTVQKRLPNRWKDHAIHSLSHRVAVIMRDVLGARPTKSDNGKFAQLVREVARLAGRRAVSKEVIFHAIEVLNTENVIRTGKPIGMRSGKPLYQELPVSDIRPAVVGRRLPGEKIYSYSVSSDGTITKHPVRITKGGEPIYKTSSDK